MRVELLTPTDVDDLLRYPAGRASRLAKRGKLPCITLPDGAIRFRVEDISKLLESPAPDARPAAGGEL